MNKNNLINEVYEKIKKIYSPEKLRNERLLKQQTNYIVSQLLEILSEKEIKSIDALDLIKL
jgi:hypothetical protein